MFGSFRRFLRAWALVLAWQLPRAQGPAVEITDSIELEHSQQQRKRHQQRLKRERHRPPPRRLPARGGYTSTKSKHKRASNHQLLRRMYRKY